MLLHWEFSYRAAADPQAQHKSQHKPGLQISILCKEPLGRQKGGSRAGTPARGAPPGSSSGVPAGEQQPRWESSNFSRAFPILPAQMLSLPVSQCLFHGHLVLFLWRCAKPHACFLLSYKCKEKGRVSEHGAR